MLAFDVVGKKVVSQGFRCSNNAAHGLEDGFLFF